MAHNGDEITMPARLGSQHAKAILSIMVRHAFDETGKNSPRRCGLESRNVGKRNS